MTDPERRQEFIPIGDKVSIFQRGKTWQVNYQHNGQQKRKSLRTSNKKEAISRAHVIEADLNRGAVPDQIRVATVGEVREAFMQWVEVDGKAKRTITQYRHVTTTIQQHADLLRISNISQLNAGFADSWRAALKSEAKKTKTDEKKILRTIYNKLIILRSLVLFAVRRRMTDVDPLANYKLRKPKPNRQPCWTPEEADRIVAAAPENYRSYFLFLRESGCRAGEGKFLTWNDVDFKNGGIHIRPKGDWKPKSGDQRRFPMTERLVELMHSMPRRAEWVFTAPSTGQHPESNRQISERRALQALKRILKKLGLDGHLHTFRHTFISQALSQGVPEAIVRDWVGHVDPAVIKLYTHITDDVSRKYVSFFSAAGSSAGGTVCQPAENESATKTK